MDYKQFSPTLVVRSACGCPVKMGDPKYLAWLEAGNSPFPPDPLEGIALASFVEAKSVDQAVDITDEMVAEMVEAKPK